MAHQPDPSASGSADAIAAVHQGMGAEEAMFHRLVHYNAGVLWALGAVDATLSALVAAARTDANLVPPMLDAARAEATLGEICGALRTEWGAYTEPAAF